MSIKLPPKLRPHDIIEIKWLDSSALSAAWSEHEESFSEEDLIVYTVGYFQSADDVVLNIVRGITTQQQEGLFAIPRAVIQKIRIVPSKKGF